MVTKAKRRAGELLPEPEGDIVIRRRPLPTVAVGALGGLVVGMTSVGSGSLITPPGGIVRRALSLGLPARSRVLAQALERRAAQRPV